MNFIDAIILAVVLVLLGLIIYFSFIRKKSECSNCPHGKSCDKKKQKKDESKASENVCDGNCAACSHRENQPPSDPQK